MYVCMYDTKNRCFVSGNSSWNSRYVCMYVCMTQRIVALSVGIVHGIAGMYVCVYVCMCTYICLGACQLENSSWNSRYVYVCMYVCIKRYYEAYIHTQNMQIYTCIQVQEAYWGFSLPCHYTKLTCTHLHTHACTHVQREILKHTFTHKHIHTCIQVQEASLGFSLPCHYMMQSKAPRIWGLSVRRPSSLWACWQRCGVSTCMYVCTYVCVCL